MSGVRINKSFDHVSNFKQLKFFLPRFEYDVQIVFDEICSSKNQTLVSVNLLMKRGSLYLKADYILPMKSFESSQLISSELISELKKVHYILDVEVDSNYNLTFCLKRPDVYRIVLEEVTNFKHLYGMSDRNHSVLLLIDNEVVNDFVKTRNNLIAQHIILLLRSNNIKVYYSGSSFAFKQDINANEIKCIENCDIDNLCSQMLTDLNVSQWKSESSAEDNLTLDAKIYLEKNLLVTRYGKDINSIVIPNLKDQQTLLRKVASIKHLITDHMKENPTAILYVASHGSNRSIWKMGILLQMFEKQMCIKSYIFNQSVKVSNRSDFNFDSYVTHHKNAIEKAMTEKYDDVTQDSKWSSRINNLIDSVVKFDFLKLNPSMSLKLDLSNCHSTEKNAGIFVQYNFARLSNIFSKFEVKVKEGYYEPLNPLDEVDFSLLKLEEEWNLFQYVITFPKLVDKILDSLLSESTLKTRYPLNGICVMLTELCHYLSLYYSKIRILAGPQKHLQSLMNSRLWLLKGIYRIMLNSFILLDIQGLDIM